MANMFRCVLASGGGDGADLIVTCSPNFAGSVITCTDGISYTKTQTCPSSSPYEVTFESIPTGTYTISGVVSGQTFSTTKTILDFDAELNDIPDGATVTPTDDIQIWLHCAGIFDKNYTTTSQVLADASTLQALISSDNAVDYMARSSTWAADITADSSAMTYISLDDYCTDALLADSTWLDAICNSTYFESVLNVKVPTMTSATTPSGEVTASSYHAGTNTAYPYKAFNGLTGSGATCWQSNNSQTVPQWIAYEFTQNVRVLRLDIKNISNSSQNPAIGTFKFQGYDDSNWVDISDTISSKNTASGGDSTYVIPNNNYYSKYRIYILTTMSPNTNLVGVDECQFYGRSAS